MDDKLSMIHLLQERLQGKIYENHKNTYFFRDERFEGSRLYDICSNLISEVTELQNETNWKYWKRTKPLNRSKIAEEIADIDHFVTQICLEMDINSEQRFRNYLKKNEINLKRQEDKY